ncbi:MAG: gluconokinase [Actinomycetota bacterium]|nr:gluconokinase [Actinomycetota bacterium]
MVASVVVLMGVSGSGKSTVGKELARQLGWDFAEGDDFHAPASIAKMAAGHELTDDDRWPWLRQIADWIEHELSAGRCGVITCSALRRVYRDVLRRPGVVFVHLSVPPEELAQRLTERTGHFMPASLLRSQLETLETPEEEEQAVIVEATGDASATAGSIRIAIGHGQPHDQARTRPKPPPTVASDA